MLNELKVIQIVRLWQSPYECYIKLTPYKK